MNRTEASITSLLNAQGFEVEQSNFAVLLQAIEFVQMQRDDELWETLIGLSLESPALTGAQPAMCHSYVNPSDLTCVGSTVSVCKNLPVSFY